MPNICQVDSQGFYTGVTAEAAIAAPGWVFADPPEISDGQVARWIRFQWAFQAEAVASAYSLPAQQAVLMQGVSDLFNAVIATGYPVNGLHVQIDTDGRTNLSGMATTGGLVLSNIPAVTWPQSYQDGWISSEGVAIPLPTAADGIALSFGAATYYSEAVQRQQALLVEIADTADLSMLQGIDITSGWPT